MRLHYLSALFMILLFMAECHSEPENTIAIKTNKKSAPVDSIKSLPVSTKTYSFIPDFEQFVHTTMAETGIPGAAIAIIKDKEVLLLKGYGVKAFGSKDSVDTHTVFRIASVSKGFASMLAGILVQNHFFDWNDHVQKYLPKFSLKNPINSSQLTIRHVLSHTTGLPLHTFTRQVEEDIPYPTLRDRLSTVNCIGPAGSIYAYQNVIYSLIGDIAEAVTQKTYVELLHEKIFKPLYMTDASASFKDLSKTKDLAMPHQKNGKGAYKVIENKSSYYSVAPAAGVNASISDMAQWLFALVGNREQVIQQTTLNQIYTEEIKTPNLRKYNFFRWPELNGASYGMGWRILNYKGETIIYHGGHVRGYRAEVAIYPKDKVGIAILVNASGELANNGIEVFLDKYFEYIKVNALDGNKNTAVVTRMLQ